MGRQEGGGHFLADPLSQAASHQVEVVPVLVDLDDGVAAKRLFWVVRVLSSENAVLGF